MDKVQQYMLNQQIINNRGKAIIEGTNNEYRADGYTNLLNKYGTSQDNSTYYNYQAEAFADDMQLVRLYEGNGLFAKIIDRPSEEAVKHGLDIDYGDYKIADYVEERLDELEFEDKFATAEKWARLYGGSIIVMLVDDGRGLEEPLDWNKATKIEELRVFERSVVQADVSQMNNFHFFDSKNNGVKFGEPQFYQVFSMYGYFLVHASRCLVFRNGRLPEQTSNSLYRYWGMPEYIKIRKALQECIVSHEDGVKLLERSVQAIYKMKNLANLLASDEGENKVLQRLQVIDMARGILNSIAIDTEGEDYDFKSIPMSGVKDITDSTCSMLSAVTNIPQTILFGASPTGMNATGESDFENYYNLVENIQKQNMKSNVRTLIKLILKQGYTEGKIDNIPTFKVKFGALWSMSESEKLANEATKAATEKTKADTAQVYMDAGVLDPSEVRESLAKEGDFDIEEVISDIEKENLELNEEDLDLGLVKTIEDSVVNAISKATEASATDSDEIDGSIYTKAFKMALKDTEELETHHEDADDIEYGVGVLVFFEGKVLVGTRAESGELCGPGGHVEQGETLEEAARRETFEEFGLTLGEIQEIKTIEAYGKNECPSTIFLCTEFYGDPRTVDGEMLNPRWMSIEELKHQRLFQPFEKSLDLYRSDGNDNETGEESG